MKSKSIFQSKTAALGFITAAAGVAAYFIPEASQFVTDHADAILTGLGIVAILLRLVTKGEVVLFPDK